MGILYDVKTSYLLAFLLAQIAWPPPVSAQDTLRAGIEGDVQAGLEEVLSPTAAGLEELLARQRAA